MAVARTGSAVHIETGTVNGNNAVTIPVDTDVCVVAASGWANAANTQAFDELTWDGGAVVDFVHVGTSFYITNQPLASLYYMTSADANWPGTGSQTLYWLWHNASISEGLSIHVDFYTGVDTSNPMVDSDTSDYAGSPASLTTIGGGTDDMFVCVAYAYTTSPVMNADTQTSIVSSLYNTAGFGFGEEQGVNDFTVTASASIGAVGMVLRASAVPPPGQPTPRPKLILTKWFEKLVFGKPILAGLMLIFMRHYKRVQKLKSKVP